MKIQQYLKAITGALVTMLGVAQATYAASPHHTIGLSGAITIAVTGLTSLYAVFATTNAPATPAAKHADTGSVADVPALPALPVALDASITATAAPSA
jgi:hypothetical protein